MCRTSIAGVVTVNSRNFEIPKRCALKDVQHVR
jgi:hypothetical protein